MKRSAWFVVLVVLVGAGCRRPRPVAEVAPPVKPAPPAVTSRDVAPFTVLEPAEVGVIKGTRAKLKVTVARRGYTGPISLEVRNLPEHVTAKAGLIKPDTFEADIELSAAPAAPAGRNSGIQVEATALAGNQKDTSSKFVVTVLEVPFALRVEPGQVQLQQGTRAVLKVNADRKGYQGPIGLELRNLPPDVSAAAKVVIPKDTTFANVELAAAANAAEGERGNVQVAGTAQAQTAYQGVSPNFSVAVVGLPFVLQPDGDVNIPYGAKKAKLKVGIQRRDYKGPINLALQGLPGNISAGPAKVADDQTSAEFDIDVAGNVPGKHKVLVFGTAAAAVNRQATSPPFVMNVEGPPFDVKLDPAVLEIPQGTVSAPWKISVVRRGYDGPIKVELRNTFKDIKTGSVTILRGQNTGKLDVAVADDAGGGDRTGLEVVGTALAQDNQQVAASGFGLRIVEPFALRAEPASIQLLEGGKSVVKVKVVRRSYDGAIELSVKNLPEKMTAGKAVIAEGKDSAEIEVAAPTLAPGGTRNDVQVVGTFNTTRKVASNALTVNLQSKLFELKVRPELLAVQQGEKALVKVTATRRNYTGPIALELRNLPAQVAGIKEVLPANQNETEVELAVGADATPSSKADVQILGTATAGGNQQVTSPPFRVDIKPGLYDLKVEPAVLKLTHGATAKLKVVAVRKGYKGAINIELKNLPKDVKAVPSYIAPNKTDTEVEVKAEPAAAEGDFIDAQARGAGGERPVLSPRFTVSIGSYGQEPALEVKATPASLKIAPGGSTKVQVTLVRKKFDGPVTVELRNLPMGLESGKTTIEKGQTTGEITLTAKTAAEVGMRPDVCVVGSAELTSGPHSFASQQLTVQVSSRK